MKTINETKKLLPSPIEIKSRQQTLSLVCSNYLRSSTKSIDTEKYLGDVLSG